MVARVTGWGHANGRKSRLSPRHGRPPGQVPEDRLRPAIHDFPSCRRRSRGWPAEACPRALDPGAGHDGGLAAYVNTFGRWYQTRGPGCDASKQVAIGHRVSPSAHSAAVGRNQTRSDAQRRHATAVSGSRCAKRHCPAFSAISASSAISALILPCVERSHVRPPEPTPCCPRRTARAAGSTALTQRSPRAQRSQRRQHDGLSRRAHDRRSSYSPGRIPCRRPPGIALLMPRKPCVGT
jgi:hypothetical protein